MPWSILHRYVLWELLRVFGLSLVAITGILVLGGIVSEAGQKGFGPDQILQLVPLLVPVTLPFTVPASILFAVSVVYGRLSHDNEITAINAAGIPVTRVIWPALLIAVILSGFMLLLSNRFIPYACHLMRTLAMQNLEELIYTMLRRDLAFNHPNVNYAIWVKEVRGHRLIKPTFIRRDAQGRYELIAQAREAELHVDLDEGVVKVDMLHCELSHDGGKTYASFDNHVIPVPLPPIGAAKPIRTRELSTYDLMQRQDTLLQEHLQLRQQVPSEHDKVDKTSAQAAGRKKLADIRKEYAQLETEYHLRRAMSFSSLFFVVLGCPVGIWFHKRDYLSAFVTCFLPIVTIYYPLMMFGINLGKEGRVAPVYSMWVGNAALGIAGLFLLYRLTRR